MHLNLDGHSVLVTGSSRGIGLAIAEGFLSEGARTVITSRTVDELTAVHSTLSEEYGKDRVMAFSGDLTDEAVAHEAATEIQRKWGGLDHLVCNVGSGQSVPPLEESSNEWDRVLRINLSGAAVCVRALRPLLTASNDTGADRGASIVFVGSVCGLEALGCPTAYAVAKAGLVAYTNNLAKALAPQGVRVNCVSPGNILFPGSTWERKLQADPERVREMLHREVPMNRLGVVEDVSNIVVFLSSERAGFVTGANWIADGGQSRSI